MGSRWRVTANLGYKVWTERGEELEEGQESGGVTMEVSIDPLDPIQRALVCGAKVMKMMKKVEALDLKVLHRAVRLLCCEEKDAPEWYHALKKEPELERKVSIRFSSHMKTLRECSILTHRSADFLLFCAVI